MSGLFELLIFNAKPESDWSLHISSGRNKVMIWMMHKAVGPALAIEVFSAKCIVSCSSLLRW